MDVIKLGKILLLAITIHFIIVNLYFFFQFSYSKFGFNSALKPLFNGPRQWFRTAPVVTRSGASKTN